MNTLDDIIERLSGLPEKDREAAIASAQAVNAGFKWKPNPGPQTEAYFSRADVLLYGGEPGGGKSQLLLGLAFNEHDRSLIMRREYSDLDRIIEDALKIHGSRDGFNGSPPPRLRIGGDQIINFRAAQRIGDEQGTMGQGRDFLGVDEATHFAESQIRFLMGWVRTETEGQRCRTVLATNPPLTAEGLWVTEMFAPWLDPRFPDPARHGELRWCVSDEDGHDLWVSGPDDAREINGKLIRPMSRTYIPASVQDNPYYVGTDYERTLDNMPEPFRSLLMGGFRTEFKDAENQVIPTAWVMEAQKRWKDGRPAGVPMCAMGVDCTGGGEDPLVIAARYDGWFDNLIVVPGKDIPIEAIGKTTAGYIVQHRSDNAKVILDMGGGYGGPAYEKLKENNIDVIAHKGSEKASGRTKDRQYGFYNMRSQVIWRFREALDPSQEGGSPIALPDSQRLVADLTAPTFEIIRGQIKVESKEDVCKRLGRSTDEGDAVVTAWSSGETLRNQVGRQWSARKPPTVHIPRANRRRR